MLDQMNIVIVGHVDHGKSTFVGRLLADTGSLPDGKLDQVKALCARNAKPFEYAFLLDALKDEQSQGITIDAARCFFKSKKRSYIIIDAPGHIEFLKNMITGAARAEAALLLIDAKEGVQENSKRHGYMLSLLGIRQVVVLVNKMDLVTYSETRFKDICTTYGQFLKEICVEPLSFIPIAARDGDNLIQPSHTMPWYKGLTVLDQMDTLQKETAKDAQPLRFPIQDIYKFTESGDDRRIFAGTLASGTLSVGDAVVFYPSHKQSQIQTIEGFNLSPQSTVQSGQATGVTLATQLYIKPGEIMGKVSDPAPLMGTTFKASLFWLGKTPMLKGKKYKLKLASSRSTVYLKDIVHTLDASDLTQSQKQQIDRHDVAECILETLKPIAFDTSFQYEDTSRFVIIDDYEIAGGGIVLESISQNHSILDTYVQKRDSAWEKSTISGAQRALKFGQKPQFILITGERKSGKNKLAKELEHSLYALQKNVYYLGFSSILSEIGTSAQSLVDRDEHIQKLGLTAHLFTEAGFILISAISDLDDAEVDILKALVSPNDMLMIHVGKDATLSDDKIDYHVDDGPSGLSQLTGFLQEKGVFPEYYL